MTNQEALDDIKARASNWNLESDVKLVDYLREFSNTIIDRTRTLADSVEELTISAEEADVALHSTVNEFLMLANKQFVENRVYDDDDHAEEEQQETSKVGDGSSSMSEEATLLKFQEAVSCGLESLKIFLGTDNGDGGEPVDIYNSRPLPFIIGTRAFMESADVGLNGDLVDYVDEGGKGGGGDFLGDYGQEEGGHPRVQDDDTGLGSRLPPPPRRPYDEEEDDDDPFASPTRPHLVRPGGVGEVAHHKQEEEEVSESKPQGMDAIKAAIAARANMLGVPQPPSETQPTSSPEKSATGPSEEEEDGRKGDGDDNGDFFDREDPYSLFGTRKARLPSTPATVSTTDQFADLFGQKDKPPIAKSSTATPELVKKPSMSYSLLFGGGDDEGLFGAEEPKQPPPAKRPSMGGGALFGNEGQGDTMTSSQRPAAGSASSSSAPQTVKASPPKPKGGLFDDSDDDDDDPFSIRPKGGAKSVLTQSFAPAPAPKPASSSLFSEEPPPPSKPAAPVTRSSSGSSAGGLTKKSSTRSILFGDDDEDDDIFSTKPRSKATPTPPAEPPKASTTSNTSTGGSVRRKSSLFDDDDDDGLFSTKPKTFGTPPKPTPPSSAPSSASKPKPQSKSSLFSDSDDPLFGPSAKKAEAKPPARRSSSLFDDGDDDLFLSKPKTSSPPKPKQSDAEPAPAPAPQASPIRTGSEGTGSGKVSSLAASLGIDPHKMLPGAHSLIPPRPKHDDESDDHASDWSEEEGPRAKQSSVTVYAPTAISEAMHTAMPSSHKTKDSEESLFGESPTRPSKEPAKTTTPTPTPAPSTTSVKKANTTSLFGDDDDDIFSSKPKAIDPLTTATTTNTMATKPSEPPSLQPAPISVATSQASPTKSGGSGKVSSLAASLGIDPHKMLPGAHSLIPPRPKHDDESDDHASDWSEEDGPRAKQSSATVYAPTAISEAMHTAMPSSHKTKDSEESLFGESPTRPSKEAAKTTTPTPTPTPAPSTTAATAAAMSNMRSIFSADQDMESTDPFFGSNLSKTMPPSQSREPFAPSPARQQAKSSTSSSLFGNDADYDDPFGLGSIGSKPTVFSPPTLPISEPQPTPLPPPQALTTSSSSTPPKPTPRSSSHLEDNHDDSTDPFGDHAIYSKPANRTSPTPPAPAPQPSPPSSYAPDADDADDPFSTSSVAVKPPVSFRPQLSSPSSFDAPAPSSTSTSSIDGIESASSPTRSFGGGGVQSAKVANLAATLGIDPARIPIGGRPLPHLKQHSGDGIDVPVVVWKTSSSSDAATPTASTLDNTAALSKATGPRRTSRKPPTTKKFNPGGDSSGGVGDDDNGRSIEVPSAAPALPIPPSTTSSSANVFDDPFSTAIPTVTHSASPPTPAKISPPRSLLLGADDENDPITTDIFATNRASTSTTSTLFGDAGNSSFLTTTSATSTTRTASPPPATATTATKTASPPPPSIRTTPTPPASLFGDEGSDPLRSANNKAVSSTTLASEGGLKDPFGAAPVVSNKTTSQTKASDSLFGDGADQKVSPTSATTSAPPAKPSSRRPSASLFGDDDQGLGTTSGSSARLKSLFDDDGSVTVPAKSSSTATGSRRNSGSLFGDDDGDDFFQSMASKKKTSSRSGSTSKGLFDDDLFK